MLEAGQVFGGRYRISTLLARGGMGEVYLADQGIEGFSRPVVIKTLLASLAERKDLVRLFLEEAKLAAQLTHPNIVHVYDFGKEDELFFFVMEYLRGSTLSELLRTRRREQRRVGPAFIAAVGSQVCSALHYANTKAGPDGQPLKVVHRDISPSNVLLSEDGLAKVLDFGIAKASTSPSLTQAGELKGKPSYMSPEQALGKPVDARSDLFSLGIVLWEAAAGHKLFSGGGTVELVTKVCKAPIDPVDRLNPEIPPELAAIIAKALDRDLSRRFQSAAEMGQALESVFQSLTTENAQKVILAELRGESLGGGALSALQGKASAIEPAQSWVPEWLNESGSSTGSSVGTPSRPPGTVTPIPPGLETALPAAKAAEPASKAPVEPAAAFESLIDIEPPSSASPARPPSNEPTPEPQFEKPAAPVETVPFDSPAVQQPAPRVTKVPAANLHPEVSQAAPAAAKSARSSRALVMGAAAVLVLAGAGAFVALSGDGPTPEPTPEPVVATPDPVVPAKPAEPAEPAVSPWVTKLKTVKAMVFSVPGDAEIWLDGKNTGKKTPYSLMVDTGQDHSIELRHPDYLPYTAKFFAAPNEPIQMAPELKPGARIQVDSIPPGAAVEIDGAKAFEAPGTSAALPLGKHLFYVRLAGHVAERREIDLSQPQVYSYAMDLVPGASVEVTSVPDGAMVLVDGQETGVKTPGTVVVPIGKKHSVGVAKEGFVPDTKQLARVAEGSPRSLEFKLVSAKKIELEKREASLKRELETWEKRLATLKKQLSGVVVDRAAAKEAELQKQADEAEKRVSDLEIELGQVFEELTAFAE